MTRNSTAFPVQLGVDSAGYETPRQLSHRLNTHLNTRPFYCPILFCPPSGCIGFKWYNTTGTPAANVVKKANKTSLSLDVPASLGAEARTTGYECTQKGNKIFLLLDVPAWCRDFKRQTTNVSKKTSEIWFLSVALASDGAGTGS